MSENLKERIISAMETDTDYKSRVHDAKVRRFYDKSSEETKDIVDNIFISLTGYSLKTLLSEENVDEE